MIGPSVAYDRSISQCAPPYYREASGDMLGEPSALEMNVKLQADRRENSYMKQMLSYSNWRQVFIQPSKKMEKKKSTQQNKIKETVRAACASFVP